MSKPACKVTPLSQRYTYCLLAIALLLALLAAGCSSGSTPTDGDSPDGDVPDGDVPDGDVDADSELPDGDTPDGDIDGDVDTPDGDIDGDVDADPDPDVDGDADDDGDGDSDDPGDPGSLAADPDPIDFGLVDLDTESSITVTVSNDAQTGSQAVNVDGIELTLSSSPYLDLDNCIANTELEPGESTTCDVVCQPGEPGQHDGVLRVFGRSADNSPLELRVDILCDTIIPIGWADPARVEFGFVDPAANQPQSRFVSLGNAGGAELSVSAIGLSDDSSTAFEIIQNPLDTRSGPLQPGDGLIVELRYTPQTGVQSLAWLLIQSDDPQTPTRQIVLSGRGMADCPASTSLNGNTCVDVCVPKESICGDTDAGIRVCNDSGNELLAETSCTDGRQCVDGYCLWQACAPGQVFCHGGAPAECSDDGVIVETAAACADDAVCPQICMPGAVCERPEQNHYCFDDNPCTEDVCTLGEGCSHPYNNDSCDDGNACTEGTRCVRGSCTGQPITCNDGNPCTSDSCDPQSGCTTAPTPGPCNDNDACTLNDRCEEGDCVGDTRSCDDGNPCTDDSCDTTSGCLFNPNSDACDDGNPCTDDDRCRSSQCSGLYFDPDDGQFCNGPEVCNPDSPEGEAIDSPAPIICNDNIACTTDSCNESGDRCDFIPDDSVCDDGNPCTVDACSPESGCTHTPKTNGTGCDLNPNAYEQCFSGQCVTRCAGDADCQDGLGCTRDVCDLNVDPGDGWCRHDRYDSLCDDGQFCNGAEICDLTQGCIQGDPVDCGDGFACTLDYCSEENRTCMHTPRNNLCDDFNGCTLNLCQPSQGCVYLPTEGSCDDGDPCTIGDICSSGECVPGTTVLACTDGNICTDDVCTAGVGCTYLYNSSPCDDGQRCTDFDTCSAGECLGTARDCDDGVFCNGTETCDEETGCITGDDINCDDGVACTVGRCDEDEHACTYDLNDELCADENPCTENEACTFSGCVADTLADGTVCDETAAGEWTCRDGQCVAPCEEDTDCDDQIPCTQDRCDTDTGFCRYSPNDQLCNDNLYCTGIEICDRFEGCLPGDGIDCDDSIACTVDSCDDTELECVSTPDNALCDDGNPCTADICDAGEGCRYEPATGACDDNNPCTTGDSCSNGVCRGEPKVCDDLNPCTADSCGAGGQCTSTTVTNGVACGSGLVERVCIAGSCVEGCTSDAACNDGIACTVDTCNPITHSCRHTALNELCDDGQFCNGEEVCDTASGCMAGEPVTCDDGLSCTKNVCDEQQDRCANPVDESICFDNNPCTDDVCTEEGCDYLDTVGSCDDGNFCTTGDTCQNGACQGRPVTCNDDNACTADSCDVFFGCVNTPIVCPQGDQCEISVCNPDTGCNLIDREGLCDDGDPCTWRDSCNGGQCESGGERDCDDDNPCTIDACDGEGCSHSAMDDGSSCPLLNTDEGVCVAGFCTRRCEAAADCRDGIACTIGTCNTTLINGIGVCEFIRNHEQCDDGLFCNGAEQCEPYVGCVPGEAIDCNDGIACTADSCDEEQDVCGNNPDDARCADGNPCTSAVCDAVLGCVTSNVDGVACDDDNRCTENDRCFEGTCGGTAVSCNDNNPCTGPDSCNPDLGCKNPARNNGSACGNEGICAGGHCAEPCEVDSDCDDGIACTQDICDSISGRCTVIPDDGACSDGRFCNGVEWCHPQFDCQPGQPVVCDDGIACTVDRCDDAQRSCDFAPADQLCADGNDCTQNVCDPTGGCRIQNLDFSPCDDGNACSGEDYCLGGLCQGGEPLDCEGSVCMLAGCDARIGCIQLPNDGADCDPDACAFFALCVDGECVPTLERDCADTNPCTEDSCDPAGGCTYQPRHGQSCDDGNACTVNDTCNSNVCTGGQQRNCDDNNPCTDDTCVDPGGCMHTQLVGACTDPLGNDGICMEGVCATDCDGPCSDNNACTEGDTCTNNQCMGTPVDCDDGNPCTDDGCNTATGCTRDNRPDGTACSLAGGASGMCESGQCIALCDTAADCNDDNPCTADSCELDGCHNAVVSNYTPCDDNDACSRSDYCLAGVCTSISVTTCADGNPCTADSCDENGDCLHTPLSDVSCSDGDPCTSADLCQAGVCTGTPIDCEDGNACTIDYCEDGSCRQIALTGESCDDDNPCTAESICSAGQCMGSATESCTDDNPCTFDSCDPITGCKSNPISGRLCDDGNPCTVGDICQAGSCNSGVVQLDCDDGNPCTADSCDSVEGCGNVEVDNGTPCDLDPGVAEACFGGTCIAYCDDDSDCDDGFDCTIDSCDLFANTCQHQVDDSVCDDGNICNGLETCGLHDGCRAGTPLACDDGIFCTDDVCDPESSGCAAWPQHYLCDDDDPCTLDRCDGSPETPCSHDPICSR